MANELIPIDEDELLYRRISVRSGWYHRGVLSAEAFSPNKYDDTGISVFRARFRSAEDSATGPSPDGYFIVVLLAGELRGSGIQVRPQPNLDGFWDISHAELPQINTTTRKTSAVLELKEMLVELAGRRPVLGPFPAGGLGGE